jgi:DNA-binding GntR family transcriptional regulator
MSMIVDDPNGDDGFDSASERLLALIGAGIISGDLAPGEKLTEIGLSKRYGVSRAPLREALLRLEERQLIERMPFSGTRVASPSLRTLGELYEVRAVLEGLAARRAAAAATPSQIEELRAAVEDGARALRDAKPTLPQAGSPTPHRLHNKIAEIAGSLELARLLSREIWRFSMQIHRQWNRSPERMQASIREHEHIVAAIEAADEELAEMLMRRHIAAAYKGQQVNSDNQ